MRGIPDFNFPAFFKAAELLRDQGHVVFNPAERDTLVHGPLESPTGDHKDIARTGFTLREALAADLGWICREADAIALLPGWENSRGARAEKAVAEGLDLIVIYLGQNA